MSLKNKAGFLFKKKNINQGIKLWEKKVANAKKNLAEALENLNQIQCELEELREFKQEL